MRSSTLNPEINFEFPNTWPFQMCQLSSYPVLQMIELIVVGLGQRD